MSSRSWEALWQRCADVLKEAKWQSRDPEVEALAARLEDLLDALELETSRAKLRFNIESYERKLSSSRDQLAALDAEQPA